MSGDALQRIAVAVTPAVMVSACGLIALGLDNQTARLAMRLRDLIHEHRSAEPLRRSLLRAQVVLLSRRHAIVARALLLDYGALFAFIVTSLLSLAQGLVALPAEIPFVSFLIGVLMLGATAILAMGSVFQARSALRLEEQEVLGTKIDTPS